MQTKLFIALLLLFTILVLQNCQTNDAIKKEETIGKVLVSDEAKLVTGLSLIIGKASKNGRIAKTQIDALLLDSALKLIDKNRGSTNYSLLMQKNLPYSLTNLVVCEKNGAFLAFLVEYINANPKNGWDMAHFQGKALVTTVDGKNAREIDFNSLTNKGGRASATICSTTVWKVTVSSAYGSYSYYETEFGCMFIDTNDAGGYTLGNGNYESGPVNALVSDSGNGVAEAPIVDEGESGTMTIVQTNSSVDPDLNSDCKSWQFSSAGPEGNYQVCAVSGIDFDFTTTYVDSKGKTRLEYVYYQFRTLYFEFPRKREDGTFITSGQAATINAAVKDLAEEAIEERFGNQPPPLGITMEQAFINELRAKLLPFGGRVTTLPNYPNTIVSNYSKTVIGNGYCP